MAVTDVFLSYPHKDQPAVLAAAEALKDAGLSVWIDNESVEVFERIHDRVAQGIASSKVVLAWYSRYYANSRPCQWELSAAWPANDGERVLAVNPESEPGHIRPATLLHRLYANASDLKALAQQVKAQAARFDCSIGQSASLGQPLHYGRELAGLNTFVGRIATLWDVHDALTRSGAAMLTGEMRSVAQLRGFGGIGKSTLAEEYALRFGAAYPGGIFWLKGYGGDEAHRTAAHRETERSRQIAEFAARLNLPVVGKGAGEIRTLLGQLLANSRRALWIVDDLPSGLTQEEAQQWLSPHASTPTLITTRDRSLSKLGKTIDVDVLSTGEAVDLLNKHIKIPDGERLAAQELAGELGNHALALEVAGSYLAMRAGEPISEFLADLRNPGEDVLEQAGELADVLPLGNSPSIMATLKTTLDSLSQSARDVLCLASCVAAAPIPPELTASVLAKLMNLSLKKADFERLKAAKEMDRYGLSRPEKSRREAINVHVLVARAARRHPQLAGRIDVIRNAAVASLIESLETMYTVGTILRLNLEVTHARKLGLELEDLAAAELLVLVANTDLQRGDLDAADLGTRRALEYCTQRVGPQALITCKARAGLATIALAKRDLQQAALIYYEIGPTIEANLPPGDRYRNGLLAGRAMLCMAAGDMTGAKECLLKLTTEIDSTPDRNEQARLGPKRLLLQLLRIAGEQEASNKLVEEITAADARIADENGIDGLVDQFLSLPAMLAAGDLATASPIIHRIEQAFREAFGEDSILTLQAKAYKLLVMGAGRDPQTASFAEDLVPRFERLLGPNNPATLEARQTQAQALLFVGRTAEALRIVEAVLPAYENIFGAEHAPVLNMKVFLAQIHHQNANYREALDIVKSVAVRAAGKNALDALLNATVTEALCLFRLGDRRGERDAWEKVLAMQKAMFGPVDPRVQATQTALDFASRACAGGS